MHRHKAILLREDERGAILVEFALVLPLFLMLLAIVLEIGLALHQQNILEKSVSTAASIAAHSNYPLDSDSRTRAANMAKTGNVSGGTPLLAGWNESEASLQITTQTYDMDGTTVPYVTVDATVPYIPLLKGLLDFLGFNDFELHAAHEEVFSQ